MKDVVGLLALADQQLAKGKGKGSNTQGKYRVGVASGSHASSLATVVVPFRDSVLTSLLKNALGGNSKTVMVGTSGQGGWGGGRMESHGQCIADSSIESSGYQL